MLCVTLNVETEARASLRPSILLPFYAQVDPPGGLSPGLLPGSGEHVTHPGRC